MVQVVFPEEHLIGSSGGVENTATQKKRKTRVEGKAL